MNAWWSKTNRSNFERIGLFSSTFATLDAIKLCFLENSLLSFDDANAFVSPPPPSRDWIRKWFATRFHFFDLIFTPIDSSLGSEAAAATAVIMTRCMAVAAPRQPIEFKADRPFLFSIRETQKNVVLFSGKFLSVPSSHWIGSTERRDSKFFLSTWTIEQRRIKSSSDNDIPSSSRQLTGAIEHRAQDDH